MAIQPLTRSGVTDRLYRVNTDSNKLMRHLPVEYHIRNLPCFLPSDIPTWTDGEVYEVGQIVYGRYTYSSFPDIYCGILRCKIAHTASAANRPATGLGFGNCTATGNLYWDVIGDTAYPNGESPCGSLADGSPYGGVNKSPTGIRVRLSGVQMHPNHPSVDAPESKWHHDYNGEYIMPIAVGYQSWSVRGGLTMHQYDDGSEGLLKWNISFQPSPYSPIMGDCRSATRKMRVYQHKSTIEDNWWSNQPLFCGSGDVDGCATGYSFGNTLVMLPDPMPEHGSDEWNAWRATTLPAKECLGITSNLFYYVGIGWGGSFEFLGYTDSRYIGYETYIREYGNGSLYTKIRFGLYSNSGQLIHTIKSGITIDWFNLLFSGSDWDVYLGGNLTAATPDSDGYFEKTFTLDDGVTIKDVGVTNINYDSFKYPCFVGSDLGVGTDYIGSISAGS